MIFLATLLACRSRTCPPVECRPEITFKFRKPLVEPYHLLVSLRGLTFETDCPFSWPPQAVGIASCTGEGFAVQGVDLGKTGESASASNEKVELMVGLQLGEPFAAIARLDTIKNSRHCPLVCYQHSGTISN